MIEDLPTLGLPTIAKARGLGSLTSSSSWSDLGSTGGKQPITLSSKSPTPPVPRKADKATGSPRPRS